MDLSYAIVREGCSCAQLRNFKKGQAVFCEEAKGNDAPSSVQFIAIKKGEVCVSTSFYNTGHLDYDSLIDLAKMKECPYRNPN